MKKFLYLFLALFIAFFSLGTNSIEAKKVEIADGYPKVANWYFGWSVSDDDLEKLSKYDLLLIDMETNYYTHDNLKKLKELNPDIILLAYISPIDICKNATDYGNNYHAKIGQKLEEYPEWILRQTNGDLAEFYPGNYIFDITQKSWRTYIANFVEDNIASKDVWDGVFYDNMWEGVNWLNQDIDISDETWKKNAKRILKKTKTETKKKNKNFIITGNSGVAYNKYINGVAFENFPSTSYGSWIYSLKKYMFILENANYSPEFGVINSNASHTGGKSDYQDFRYGLASALLYNGFYSYDNSGHDSIWWYDEYEVSLGEPVSSAYNLLNIDNASKIQEGVWRRDFENGIVLINSTDSKREVVLETGYEKINGDQDPDVNNGKITGKVTLDAKDGLILLGRSVQLKEESFVNSYYAKVYNKKGKRKRNAFLTYTSEYAGSKEVIYLKNGKTIVFDDTYIEVYKDGARIAKFAPFGPGYSGGLNVDAGRLYAKKKKRRKNKGKYYIVAGSAKGGHVRIFTVKGKVKHNGFFPYGENFTGGVDVALGNLNSRKGLEIVTAPGMGGGPHIKIFSKKGKLIDPGFMAYKSSLRTGIQVAVGNTNAKGRDEIITTIGTADKPKVKIFNSHGKLKKKFRVFKKGKGRDFKLGTTDVENNNSRDEIVINYSILD